jgi:outer membrane biosynthesis protein TonB
MPMRPRILFTALVAAFFGFSPPCHTEEAIIPQNFQGVILHAPEPDYPANVERRVIRAQGVYRLVINQKTGAVDEVGILKHTGVKTLDAGSVMTFFQWKFRPGTLKQLDVPVLFDTSVHVLLKDAGSR